MVLTHKQVSLFMEEYDKSTFQFLDDNAKPTSGSPESYTLLANILVMGYQSDKIGRTTKMSSAQEVQIAYSACFKVYNETFINSFSNSARTGVQDVERISQRKYLDKYLYEYTWYRNDEKDSAVTSLPSQISSKIFQYLKDAQINKPFTVPGISGTFTVSKKSKPSCTYRICDVDIYQAPIQYDHTATSGQNNQKKLAPEHYTLMNTLNKIVADQSISSLQKQYLDKHTNKLELKGMKLVNHYKYSLVSPAESCYFIANVTSPRLFDMFTMTQSAEEAEINQCISVHNTTLPVLYVAPSRSGNFVYIAVFRYIESVEDEDYVKNFLIDKCQVNNIKTIDTINSKLFEMNHFVYLDE